jgi:hypothetical protein
LNLALPRIGFKFGTQAALNNEIQPKHSKQ